MRVYLSVDMEGLAGVSHPEPTARGDPGYEAAVALTGADPQETYRAFLLAIRLAGLVA